MRLFLCLFGMENGKAKGQRQKLSLSGRAHGWGISALAGGKSKITSLRVGEFTFRRSQWSLSSSFPPLAVGNGVGVYVGKAAAVEVVAQLELWPPPHFYYLMSSIDYVECKAFPTKAEISYWTF